MQLDLLKYDSKRISFKGRYVLVTGHSRGIGKSIYDHFQETEAVVFGISSDFVDFNSPEDVLECATKLSGGFKADILINCAGVNARNELSTTSIDDMSRMYNINVVTPLILSQVFSKYMIQNKWGRIINIGSIYADRAKAERIGYVTTKHALLGLTRAMACDLMKHNVSVNMISPAITDTDMTRKMMGDSVGEKIKLLSPSDIAATVLSLCSVESGFITGQNIIVNNEE